jgi:hypothetical protein
MNRVIIYRPNSGVILTPAFPAAFDSKFFCSQIVFKDRKIVIIDDVASHNFGDQGVKILAEFKVNPTVCARKSRAGLKW